MIDADVIQQNKYRYCNGWTFIDYWFSFDYAIRLYLFTIFLCFLSYLLL